MITTPARSAARFALALVAMGGLSLGVARAQTAAPASEAARDALPGKAVFDEHCAVCHLHPDVTRAVPVDQLHTYSADRINTALTTGIMRAQGSSLSDEEREQVVAYLAAPAGATVPGAATPVPTGSATTGSTGVTATTTTPIGPGATSPSS